MNKKNRCPNEEILAAYVERLLPQRQMAKVEKHLVHCSQCRELVLTYAQIINPTMAADVVPVPEKVTQRAIDEVLGGGPKPTLDSLRHGAGTLIRSGLRIVEWLSPQPSPAAVAVRSGESTCLDPVVIREKQFGDLRFLITVQQNEQQTMTVQVAWAEPSIGATACRIALFRNDRESASLLLDAQPVLFENMPFDAYNLVFYSSGKRIGEYRFDIQED